MQLDGDTCKEVFTIGARRSDPCLQPLMNGNTLVLQDENQVYFSKDCTPYTCSLSPSLPLPPPSLQFSYDINMQPIDRSPLTWSDLPSHVVHVHPYVIGLLPKSALIQCHIPTSHSSLPISHYSIPMPHYSIPMSDSHVPFLICASIPMSHAHSSCLISMPHSSCHIPNFPFPCLIPRFQVSGDKSPGPKIANSDPEIYRISQIYYTR